MLSAVQDNSAAMAWNWAANGQTRVRCLEAEEALVFEGDPATTIYEVLEGTLMIYKVFQDGRRHVILFARPGDIIGFDQTGVFDFDCDALTAAKVRVVPKKGLLRAALEEPGFGQRLLEFAAGQIATARRRSITLGRKTALERVATFLLDLGERGAPSVDRIPVPMSRAEIADYLGLTTETVSRNITKLRSMGIIDLPGGGAVRVRDKPALRLLAECVQSVHKQSVEQQENDA